MLTGIVWRAIMNAVMMLRVPWKMVDLTGRRAKHAHLCRPPVDCYYVTRNSRDLPHFFGLNFPRPERSSVSTVTDSSETPLWPVDAACWYADYRQTTTQVVSKRVAVLQIPFFPNHFRRQYILLFYFQDLWFSMWYFDYGGLGCDAVLFD